MLVERRRHTVSFQGMRGGRCTTLGGGHSVLIQERREGYPRSPDCHGTGKNFLRDNLEVMIQIGMGMSPGLLGEGLELTGPGYPGAKAHRVESLEGEAR